MDKTKKIEEKIKKINQEMYKKEKEKMKEKVISMVDESKEGLVVMTDKESLINCSPIMTLQLMGNAIRSMQERCCLSKDMVLDILDISEDVPELTDETLDKWMKSIKERMK